jgi:hypothetical protein
VDPFVGGVVCGAYRSDKSPAADGTEPAARFACVVADVDAVLVGSGSEDVVVELGEVGGADPDFDADVVFGSVVVCAEVALVDAVESVVGVVGIGAAIRNDCGAVDVSGEVAGIG